MELPTTAVLPSWTRYGYPLLTTVPFHAVHRTTYEAVPRLFPAQLHSYRVAYPQTASASRPDCVPLNEDFEESALDALGVRLSRTHFEEDGRYARFEDVNLFPFEDRSRTRRNSRVGASNPFVPSDVVDSMKLAEVSRCGQSVDDRAQVTEDLSAGRASETRGTSLAALCDSSPECASVLAPAPMQMRPRAKRAPWVPKRRRQNTACTVAIGSEYFVAFAQGGAIGRARLYGVKSSDRDVRVVYVAAPLRSQPIVHAYYHDFVRCVDGFSADGMTSEPAHVAFGTSKAVVISSIGLGGKMAWDTGVNVEGLHSIGYSRSSPSEFLTLSSHGLHLHAIDRDCTVARGIEFDMWPLSLRHKYFKVQFGAHPRVALLASRTGLHRVDLRSKLGIVEAGPDLLFDIRRDWHVSGYDGGLRVLETHPRVPFLLYAASDERLGLIDERMSRTLLSSWSLVSSRETPNAISCVGSVFPGSEEYGEVIALSCPKDGSLSVFHTHGPTIRAALSADERGTSSKPGSSSRGSSSVSSGPGARNRGTQKSGAAKSLKEERTGCRDIFPCPPVLWSDFPLCHLESYAPTEGLCGMAILPHPHVQLYPYHDAVASPQGGACFTLVQVSRKGGAIGQLIGCNTFKDDDRRFESNDDDSRFGRRRDSSVALREAQLSFHPNADRERLLDRPNDGVRALGTMKRPHSVSCLDIRGRIMSVRQDERAGAESDDSFLDLVAPTLPRPDVVDRPLVLKLQGQESSVEEDDSALMAFDPDFMREFLQVPRTLSEIAQVVRLGRPHSRTALSPGALLEVLLSSSQVSSYQSPCAFLEGDSGSCTLFEWKEEDVENDNVLTQPVDGSPFASQLDDLDNLFYKRVRDPP